MYSGFDVRVTARYGLAILRIVLGIAMLVHGWSKLSGGVDNVAGFFGGQLGIPAPQLMAWVVTIVELVGGILLVVGFLTQIVGILIALDMLGAILFAYLLRGAPFIDRGQISWEKEANFRLPVAFWKEMMDHYYPGTAWLSLHRDTFDQLHRYKRQHGFPTWEQALESLLAESGKAVP